MSAAEGRRRIDRQRRSRIIDGAIEVLGEHGVQGLRHRRVAEAARVPLGSTTYYFSSLDELLAAALARAVEQDLAELAERFGRLGPDDDVAEALAETIVEAAGPGRVRAIVATELYAAALRNEALRGVVATWDQGWQAVLAPHIGELSARGIGAAAGGILQQALIRGEQPSMDEMRELFGVLLPR